METAVLLPVKAFRESKLRLATSLDPAQRVRLARAMAEQVVRSAHELPVWIVCDDEEVATWAADVGASVVWTPSLGLNAAVDAGVDHLAEEGADRVVVAHADLPLATDLRPIGDFAGVTLVPDRRDDGTNVISLPSTSGFRFHYGPSSFRRHHEEAVRRGLEVRVVVDPALGFDLDTPTDLDQLRDHPLAHATFLAANVPAGPRAG